MKMNIEEKTIKKEIIPETKRPIWKTILMWIAGIWAVCGLGDAVIGLFMFFTIGTKIEGARILGWIIALFIIKELKIIKYKKANGRKTMIKKSKFILFALLVFFGSLLLIGIYNNPNKEATKIDMELEQILFRMNSTNIKMKSDVAENQSCFGDESLQNGTSAECIINLRNIQETFRNADKENIGKLEKYYQESNTELDNATKLMIENSLRLYKSNSYSDLIDAYDRYFTAYIKWHKFFRDIVGIKGIDNLTDKELTSVQSLAQEVVGAEENLQLKINTFSDYLHENFDKKFVESLTNYAENLKK